MKNKIENKAWKLPTALSLLTIGLVVGMLVVSNSNPLTSDIIEEIRERSWQPGILADNDPGAGASGVLRAYVVTQGLTYTSNITETWGRVLEYGDDNNTHIGSGVNYSTTIDIVVKVRWNKTHAFSDSNNTWMGVQWTRANITAGELAEDDTDMDEYNITGTVSDLYIWMHYVHEGESLTRGQNVSSCSFTFDAYY